MKYGYVRVSTKEQNTDRQYIALQRAGVSVGNIYEDKQSGKDFDRMKYQQLIATVKPGDVIYIKSIDRLGRRCCSCQSSRRKIWSSHYKAPGGFSGGGS